MNVSNHDATRINITHEEIQVSIKSVQNGKKLNLSEGSMG
jgi:hypothetical protein